MLGVDYFGKHNIEKNVFKKGVTPVVPESFVKCKCYCDEIQGCPNHKITSVDSGDCHLALHLVVIIMVFLA